MSDWHQKGRHPLAGTGAATRWYSRSTHAATVVRIAKPDVDLQAARQLAVAGYLAVSLKGHACPFIAGSVSLAD